MQKDIGHLDKSGTQIITLIYKNNYWELLEVECHCPGDLEPLESQATPLNLLNCPKLVPIGSQLLFDIQYPFDKRLRKSETSNGESVRYDI